LLQQLVKQKLGVVSDIADDVLLEYTMVILLKRKAKEQIREDLSTFLQNETNNFVDWVWDTMVELGELERPDIEPDSLGKRKSNNEHGLLDNALNSSTSQHKKEREKEAKQADNQFKSVEQNQKDNIEPSDVKKRPIILPSRLKKDIYWQWREEEPPIGNMHTHSNASSTSITSSSSDHSTSENLVHNESHKRRLDTTEQNDENVKRPRLHLSQAASSNSNSIGDTKPSQVTFTVTLNADLLSLDDSTNSSKPAESQHNNSNQQDQGEPVVPPRATDGTFKNMSFVAPEVARGTSQPRGRGRGRGSTSGGRGGGGITKPSHSSSLTRSRPGHYRARGLTRGRSVMRRGNMVWVAEGTPKSDETVNANKSS